MKSKIFINTDGSKFIKLKTFAPQMWQNFILDNVNCDRLDFGTPFQPILIHSNLPDSNLKSILINMKALTVNSSSTALINSSRSDVLSLCVRCAHITNVVKVDDVSQLLTS